MKVYTVLGTTTTLKIYNKMLEFRKHDMKKLYSTSFDLDKYLSEIDGFLRFECEIKKKKLEDIYNKRYIRVNSVKYEELKKVWSDEFMKLLSYFESDLTIVRNKEDIERRINTMYANKQNKARILYNFYTSIVLDGIKTVKARTPKQTYYRNIKLLKDLNIDLTQRYTIKAERETVDFNPFCYKEVV